MTGFCALGNLVSVSMKVGNILTSRMHVNITGLVTYWDTYQVEYFQTREYETVLTASCLTNTKSPA
jgi:hypothetical protein